MNTSAGSGGFADGGGGVGSSALRSKSPNRSVKVAVVAQVAHELIAALYNSFFIFFTFSIYFQDSVNLEPCATNATRATHAAHNLIP